MSLLNTNTCIHFMKKRPKRVSPPTPSNVAMDASGPEVILLNPSESERFIHALNADPVPPTPRMTKALGFYRTTVVER